MTGKIDKYKPKKKRHFWNLVSILPKFLRHKIIRSRFEVNYELDPEIIFKLASTKDEIRDALNLVYEAYRDLNYIDENSDRLHITKYLTLPITTILIIKRKEEVIGTISIILDSSLGLPTETTWKIDELRKNKMNMAEISALTIKKEMKHHNGKLLLPLLKFMYLYCMNILKIDAIVIAITHEVEPFYTGLLLYKKMPDSRGQNHDLVKGNKSSCCFQELNDPLRNSFFKTYGHKDKKYNLYHYFFEYETSNIHFPIRMNSLQAQLKEKNFGMVNLLKEKEHLFSSFSDKDKLIIENLRPDKSLSPLCKGLVSDRRFPRLSTNINASAAKEDSNIIELIKIFDISLNGLKIKCLNNENTFKINDIALIKLDASFSKLTFMTKIIWIGKNQYMGLSILAVSEKEWNTLYQEFWMEFTENSKVKIQEKKRAN